MSGKKLPYVLTAPSGDWRVLSHQSPLFQSAPAVDVWLVHGRRDAHLMVLAVEGDFPPPAQLADHEVAWHESSNESFRLLERGPVQVKSGEGYRLVYDSISEGKALRAHQSIVVTPGAMYSLMGLAPPEEFDPVRSDFEALLSSLVPAPVAAPAGAQVKAVAASAKGPSSERERAIRALSKPSIRMVTASASSLPPGASKLGGAPDLPAEVKWPEQKGVPLSFVAQIRLEELRGMPGAELLPPRGMLSFFYDAESQPWGGPIETDGWKVLFLEDGTALTPREVPAALQVESRFQPLALQARVESSYPPPDSPALASLKLDEAETDWYLASVLGGEDRRHRLLGFPDQIQNDLGMDAEISSTAPPCADGACYRDPSVLKRSQRWQLLLQIDSEDEAGMMWGDAGRLYFMIREDDLSARRFDRTWMILQCY